MRLLLALAYLRKSNEYSNQVADRYWSADLSWSLYDSFSQCIAKDEAGKRTVAGVHWVSLETLINFSTTLSCMALQK